MRALIDYTPAILSAFRKRNQRRLRKLNDHVLNDTALECNKINFQLAIVSYALSKIVSKPRFLRRDFDSCHMEVGVALENLIKCSGKNNETQVLACFKEIEKAISCFDSKDPRFAIDLITKGKLKMAATFYAQGMSLGVASEMTGMQKQEILDYAGQTMMFDRLKEEKTIKERMKVARQLISG
ncbi:hypothetical protein JXA56_03030 [Candidatus Micrarchaeota archaeon]|nr:hypothetical protein [Candidatus Micrarchaeota archaeon]